MSTCKECARLRIQVAVKEAEIQRLYKRLEQANESMREQLGRVRADT